MIDTFIKNRLTELGYWNPVPELAEAENRLSLVRAAIDRAPAIAEATLAKVVKVKDQADADKIVAEARLSLAGDRADLDPVYAAAEALVSAQYWASVEKSKAGVLSGLAEQTAELATAVKGLSYEAATGFGTLQEKGSALLAQAKLDQVRDLWHVALTLLNVLAVPENLTGNWTEISAFTGISGFHEARTTSFLWTLPGLRKLIVENEIELKVQDLAEAQAKLNAWSEESPLWVKVSGSGPAVARRAPQVPAAKIQAAVNRERRRAEA